ncbi:ADP-ribose diphosphatase [Bathymodiolus japonicus methanotrophic gill symbiont]|uniref:ADP compounds hydrolase NudE n=1 Tax=Bathymodiolus japonicus methanotrophic gill symbiont TaxID=113269 RepID=UPI001B7658D8|nr:ADP compounds hydrolase NudE [Bathymodiolus japonicus methanotrophic gill symbiont]GFO71869.1 ADP-ribose diphosphatase [Bathymodiolus japonicus methanotrophic gill symbiont]
MSQEPKILNRKIVAQSRLFRIESLDLEFSNGATRQYERLMRGSGSNGAVLIVPMLDPQTVLLIREYSGGVERYELGLAKGKIDAGETALEAANRELKEEVGYGANNLQQLSSFSITPSYMEHMTEIILAQDLYPEKLPGDEPEELEVVPWKLDNLTELVNSGQCTEARSIAALYMVRDYLLQC